jgi:hypothetical protein
MVLVSSSLLEKVQLFSSMRNTYCLDKPMILLVF